MRVVSGMPKKVSEKSLELNIGSELLDLIRWRWRMPKAYLRGLTQQAEERREGVDFFTEMSPATRIFAFQFKAPKGQWGTPCRTGSPSDGINTARRRRRVTVVRAPVLASAGCHPARTSPSSAVQSLPVVLADE